jgi:hypothetical protein|tara:strand:- start:1780 stop:1986 length:207 start_codon:yes stop_codon:yes gene_type:complete
MVCIKVGEISMSMSGEIENTEREIIAAKKHLDNLKKRLFELQESAQFLRKFTANERQAAIERARLNGK